MDAWAKKRQIWCASGGRLFQANIDNVAVERDFYKFERLNQVVSQ